MRLYVFVNKIKRNIKIEIDWGGEMSQMLFG